MKGKRAPKRSWGPCCGACVCRGRGRWGGWGTFLLFCLIKAGHLGLFATLAEAGAQSWPLISPTGAAGEFAQLAERGVTAVEKVLALQRVPMFARVDAADMLALSRIARVAPFDAGARLFEASTAPALWVVLSGDAVLESPGLPGFSVPVDDLLGPPDED